ncbi:hypothetical protein [Clostridium sp. DL1XJH146]
MKSKVKIYFTVIIILSMILTGCGNKEKQNNSNNMSSDVENTLSEDETGQTIENVENNKDEKSNEDKEVENSDKEVENKEETEEKDIDSTESGQGTEVENNNDLLAALLPSEIGYTWNYTGSFDYEHTATLNSIDKKENQLIYYVTGEVKEYVQEELDETFMVNEEQVEGVQGNNDEVQQSEGTQENQQNQEYDELDNSIDIQYIIKDGALVQKKNSVAMMDTFFDELILIKVPLEENTTWTQRLKDVEGNEYNMKGTITWKRVKNGKTLYTVEYKDIDGNRYEERVIEEGVGVIKYSSQYPLDGLMMEYGYSLNQ